MTRDRPDGGPLGRPVAAVGRYDEGRGHRARRPPGGPRDEHRGAIAAHHDVLGLVDALGAAVVACLPQPLPGGGVVRLGHQPFGDADSRDHRHRSGRLLDRVRDPWSDAARASLDRAAAVSKRLEDRVERRPQVVRHEPRAVEAPEVVADPRRRVVRAHAAEGGVQRRRIGGRSRTLARSPASYPCCRNRGRPPPQPSRPQTARHTAG